MKRYRCKKEIVLDCGDKDCSESEKVVVRVGDIYEYDEDFHEPSFADKPAVRLCRVHDTPCAWIEIYHETLSEHFEEIPRKGDIV